MTWTAYELWSRGRLLGHSNLAFARWDPLHRAGWFEPTPVGLKLLPLAIATRQATLYFAEFFKRMKAESPEIAIEDVHIAPEYADCLAAVSHEEGLELELRTPDGVVIPTEDIGIQDTHALLKLAEAYKPREDEPELTEEEQEMVNEMIENVDRSEAWEATSVDEPLPQYQIMVTLLDEFDVP